MKDKEESRKRLLRRWQKVRKRQAPVERIFISSKKYNRKKEKGLLMIEIDGVDV